MKLIRYGQSRCEKDEDSSYHLVNKDGVPQEKAVRMYFSNFGYGGKRGKFGAELTWSDVQQFIQDFSKMGHPEATEHEAIIERKRWERNRQRMKEALAS